MVSTMWSNGAAVAPGEASQGACSEVATSWVWGVQKAHGMAAAHRGGRRVQCAAARRQHCRC